MIPQPHPTDGMTDKQKEAYFSQKTIKREVSIIIDPRTGNVGGNVNDFSKQEKADVNKASSYLE